MPPILKYLLIAVMLYVILLLLAYMFQNRMIFFPQRLDKHHDFELLDKQDEEVFLTTTDNQTIHGLLFRQRNKQSKGVILYFHGNAGSLANWQYVKETLWSLGYDLFIIDFRGYGKSTGTPTEAGLYADARAARNYLEEAGYAAKDIVLFGRSIGAALAVALAADDKYRALVLEAPFTTLPAMAKKHYPFLFPGFLLNYRFDNIAKAPRVKMPVLILHGTSDHIVPVSHSETLAKTFAGKVRLKVIEGGGHNDLSSYLEWETALEAFFREVEG